MQGKAEQGPAIRKHARVVCDDVAAGVKIEDTEEWIQVAVGDLSLGGAFLVTDRFIVEGTQVDVGFAFPSGIRLFFVAEVARAVSASARGPAGLGVQFLSPTRENLQALSREMEPRTQAAPMPQRPAATSPGQATAAQQHSPSAETSAPAGGALELTTTIYERLRIPPDCDDAALLAGLERLIASVDSGIEQVPPGRQRDQALVFKQTLERMRPICQDPIKRAAYDFHHGIVRAEERIAAAAARRGPPLLKLQEAWKRIFMTEVREAKRLFMEARRGGPDAGQLMAQALQLDPFNPQYRTAAQPKPQQAQPQQAPPQQPPFQQPPPPQPAFQQPPPQQPAFQQPPPQQPAPAVSPNPFGAPPPFPEAPATPAPPPTAAPPTPAPAPQQPPAPVTPAQDDDFFGGLDE